MNIKQHLRKQIFLFVMLFFLVGCTAREEQPTFLETNCALPCWNGIIPGETSKEDVLKILATLDNVDKKSIREVKFGGAYEETIMFSINTGLLFGSHNAEMNFKENRVGKIGFWGALNLTLGQTIALTGQPEWVDRWWDRGGNKLRILNLKEGIMFGLVVRDGQEISEKDVVTGVELFSPAEFQMLADNGMIFPRSNFAEIMKTVIPWQGYGNVDEKYPMLFPSTK